MHLIPAADIRDQVARLQCVLVHVIVYPDDDTVLVARNVEYRAAVLEDACAADSFLQLRRRCPISLAHLPVPRHHRLTRISTTRALANEGSKRAERDDPHRVKIA